MDPRPVENGGETGQADWCETFVLSYATLHRPIRIHYHKRGATPLMNDSIYIHFSSLYWKGYQAHYKSLKQGGYVNYGALQLGADEQGTDDTSFYSSLFMILRTIWVEHLYRPSTIPVGSVVPVYIPLGTHSGLKLDDWTGLIPTSRRKYLCNFMGSIRGTRNQTLNSLSRSNRKRSFIFVSPGFGSKKNIHPILYRHVLLDSMFTLCPGGRNQETYRFYEALEAGSIPIVEQSKNRTADWLFVGLGSLSSMTEVPIPTVRNWSEVNSILDHYTQHTSDMDRLQDLILTWWADVRQRLQDRIRDHVDAAFERVYGSEDLDI